MKSLYPVACLASIFLTGIALEAKEETVVTANDHIISLDLPDGFTFSSTQENGVVTAEISDTKHSFSLRVDFVPDPNARLGSEEGQKNLIAEVSQNEAEHSVEKSYDFLPLEPKTGGGIYCVFTDATVSGKPIPPGEFLKLTRGVKSWSGVAVVFSLVSQDVTSDEYKAVMKLLKQSTEEKKPAAPTV